MEALSEQERFENRNLSHDAPATPEQLALQALIDQLALKREQENG